MSTMHLQPVATANTVEEQRARWERKRSRTARELVETEQRYLEQLDLVITYFVTILKAKGTLLPAVRAAIFGPLESIHLTSQTLLHHLERGCLGQGLDSFCRELELYGHYAENLEPARKALQEQVKKNKAFRRFKKLQESRPEFLGLQLEDLLPLPLQRLHQYKHLLRDLMENTSPDCAEFQQLARAVKSISKMSHWVRDTARSHENSLQLLRVQKLLKGRKVKVLAPALLSTQDPAADVERPGGHQSLAPESHNCHSAAERQTHQLRQLEGCQSRAATPTAALSLGRRAAYMGVIC
ncbi:rho guanine nucleotide exchange factor 39 isoform X2 [Alligator mississippiensis]|uniref:rho guanine nucleotide exchange factor 39 isoform X2 n=1 Tax=Alligator mississippiensis TaxID=8496 RepID=UPI002877C041|nr:rho guanine nucleotide exchange factor 39 isoform X2 [Alligator mississippiensis]